MGIGGNNKKIGGTIMFEVEGKYAKATIFTDNVEQEAITQIIELCNQDFVKDSKIAIMPDCHAGKGCVIGFTANLGNKVIPNLVGVDISCGMLTVKLDKLSLDLDQLDNVIHKYIPAGFAVHDSRQTKFEQLTDLYCYRELHDAKRILKSIGTLGSGNHFIEIDKDDDDCYYLVIHSGSRNLGKQVADYYQNLAIELCSGKEEYYKKRDEIIKVYKENGQKHLIAAELKNLKGKYDMLQPKISAALCYLENEYKDKYLHDMYICQEYATLNRTIMADIILDKMIGVKLNDLEHFETIHNYISPKDNIIRKGSVAAYADEKILIPINMRDGSIVATGKGNVDWNYSAPHGAGRLMSRSKAKELLSMEDYQSTMEGIYSTCVDNSTLDEAPMAYKPIEEILSNIKDTVDIINIIKPVYNFKAHQGALK